MIKRDIEQTLARLMNGFPVVVVAGPRQSGKTTLLQQMLPDYHYFNLEDPDTFVLVEADPGGFIRTNNKNVIIDEVQKMPQLLSYIQVLSDEQKEMGNFLLSGSENILLSEKISQSLAGRAAYLNLFPFALTEIAKTTNPADDVYEQLLKGCYPAVYDRDVTPLDYYNQYLATYIERDVKQITNVHNLALFRKFLALLAGRVGNLVNYASLSNDVGVDAKTIENWLSILEASFLLVRLQPFHSNLGKRHIKSAKMYFTDPGIVCRLLGIRSANELFAHPLIGNIFENFCIAEALKQRANFELPSKFYFYRDAKGKELDLIVEDGLTLTLVEIKSAQTYASNFRAGLDFFESLIQDSHYRIGEKSIIYTGKTAQVGDVVLYNWRDCSQLFHAGAQ
ncbi:MAG: ATP-binding protein [Coriobacteriia bacterium]|nr:ATP-binding protein [Coriobacteriia bacterium]